MSVLTYLGDGQRRYDKQPSQIHRRTAWEFQAVLKGNIGLRLPNGAVYFQRRHLWLFPPNHPHGWDGKEGTAEVAVFHFPNVPEILRKQVQGSDFVEMALDAAQCTRLRRLAQMARSYWRYPSAGMLLCHEHILLELSLLFLESERSLSQTPIKAPSEPIERSLLWFSQRMESDPRLDEVARASGVSPAHLRRLFHQTFQMSPKALFDQLRFQRAIQLMSDPRLKLATISLQCGFSSASAFSRAFKNKFGRSPETARALI